MLRWTLGYMCLFQFWFPQCVCPAWDCWVIWQFCFQFLKNRHTVLHSGYTSFWMENLHVTNTSFRKKEKKKKKWRGKNNSLNNSRKFSRTSLCFQLQRPWTMAKKHCHWIWKGWLNEVSQDCQEKVWVLNRQKSGFSVATLKSRRW